MDDAPNQDIEILTSFHLFVLKSSYFKLRNNAFTYENNFSKLETSDDGRVRPKHVVRRKRDNNKMHCRRKYIVRNK
jgi:hypothetical protein